jgi:hypothetical protein
MLGTDKQRYDLRFDVHDYSLTRGPDELDLLIAHHRAINAAEINFARLIDETGWDIEPSDSLTVRFCRGRGHPENFMPA